MLWLLKLVRTVAQNLWAPDFCRPSERTGGTVHGEDSQMKKDKQNECPNCGEMQGEREKAFMSPSGDKYVVDENGQITQFKYHAQDMAFSFAYGDDGDVLAIDSSTGWTWKKTKSSDFSGWVVRNYFDRWQVADEECTQVFVEPTGIRAKGRNVSLMGLPDAN
jgi:hypothetical protein